MIHVKQGDFTFEEYTRSVLLIAKYQPFYDLQFGAVAKRIEIELLNRTCLLAFDDEKLIGYCGWVITSQERADRWIQKKAQLPLHDEDGDSAIITHVVTDAPEENLFKRYLVLFRSLLSEKKIYRLKVFNDGRDEIRRRPITVRNQK